MISFIIIGKNEGWKLSKCIESIELVNELHDLASYEIIYVDSNSDDDSITRAQQYLNIRILKLTKIYNPPIARNIGAFHSKGDVLVFIDGDMEINPRFFKAAFQKQNLIKPLVGGAVEDRIISNNGHIIKKTAYHLKKEPYYKLITGGAFLIERELWEAIGGMDNRFVKGADPELGLRLAKQGKLLYCLPEIFVCHNNDKYVLENRLRIEQILKGYTLYSSMLMYRKNIFSKQTIIRLIKHEKSFIALLVSILLAIITSNIHFLFLYLFVNIFRSMKTKKTKYKLEKIIFFFLRDLFTLIAYFTFFPKPIENKSVPVEFY